MCGNGYRIYIAIKHIVLIVEITLYIRRAAPAGCFVAAAGAAARGMFAQPFASTTPRASGTSSWAFALPRLVSFWIFTLVPPLRIRGGRIVPPLKLRGG